MKKIIYISYTGLLEPLGRSQVLNLLNKIGGSCKIKLYTFEKIVPGEIEEINVIKKKEIRDHIQWKVLKYHRSPRLLATIYDILNCTIKILSTGKKEQISLLHARGHISAIIAMIIFKIRGTPFIFDMRGLWPDQMVNAGRLNENGIIYRTLKKIEFQILVTCTKLEVNTNALLNYLDMKHPEISLKEKTHVFPSYVDLDHFKPNSKISKSKYFHVGIVGTVTGWANLTGMLEFFSVVRDQNNKSKLTIVTQDDPELIYKEVRLKSIKRQNINVIDAEYNDVPALMNTMDVGIFLYHDHLSEISRAPTKMGEFLACGVPCIGSACTGDVKFILESENVGVSLSAYRKKDYLEAYARIKSILTDSELKNRCRDVAEKYFSIEKNKNNITNIYNSF
jgi:glycosyltransferase involved in cell wall biosynthesis